MKMLRMLGSVVVLIGLVGCAATPKPELSSEDYTRFAKGYLLVDFCSWKGWISPDTAALGKRYIQSTLGGFTHDATLFNNAMHQVKSSESAPEQGVCNRLAVAIKEQQQSIMLHNQVVDQGIQATKDSANSTGVRNTFCNRIGTQLLCNTY